jgi:hypothetical protein
MAASFLMAEAGLVLASPAPGGVDQAMRDSLDVTHGIEAHDTCGSGEPIALYEAEWMHVYNDQARLGNSTPGERCLTMRATAERHLPSCPRTSSDGGAGFRRS